MDGLTRLLKFAIILHLFTANFRYAYGEPVYPSDTTIFFGNGVLVDEDGARACLL